MNYQQLNEKLTGRNAERRKLENNTYAERRGECIAIRLHATDIMTFHPDGRIVLNSGGWKTVTTKARMNEYLPPGLQIWQNRGTWNWSGGLPYTDEDWVDAEGKVHAQKKDDKKEQALRKKILAYAKLYGENLPMPPPSGGDCWYCAMHTTDGKPLGEAHGDTSHLLSHMEEKYLVPSLALTAMKAANCGDLILYSAFHTDGVTRLAKSYLPRAVRRYLYKQFGLPS